MPLDPAKPVGSVLTPPRPPDSMLGRPAASEDFGVPLQLGSHPVWESVLLWLAPDWPVWVVFGPLGILLLGSVALIALAVAPAQPVDATALMTAMVYGAFTLAFILILALLAVERLVDRRRRRAWWRAYLWHQALKSREFGPRQGP